MPKSSEEDGWGFIGRRGSGERHCPQREQTKQKGGDRRAPCHSAWPVCPLVMDKQGRNQMMLEGKTEPEQQGLVSGEADGSPDSARSQRQTQSRLTPPSHNSSMSGLNLRPHSDTGTQTSSFRWPCCLIGLDSFTGCPVPGQYVDREGKKSYRFWGNPARTFVHLFRHIPLARTQSHGHP